MSTSTKVAEQPSAGSACSWAKERQVVIWLKQIISVPTVPVPYHLPEPPPALGTPDTFRCYNTLP
jgi:hypothetical protein